MKRLRLVAAALVVLGLGWPASPLAARDDFLRATSRELTARERQALEARIAELGNPDPVVRNAAVRNVAAMGSYALPALQDALRRGSDPKLVRNACLALGALGDVKALAILERWFLEETHGEEPTRAALFALARGRTPVTPELADALRKLILEAPLATVREAALICAGARKVVGLPDILKGPLQSERNARVRGCMLLALAECSDPAAVPLVLGFLDGRKVRDEKLRRAALYAIARLGEIPRVDALLRFEPDQHEVAAYAIALGAFTDPQVVERLGRLLVREREAAAGAVHSLAFIATPEAKDWLARALSGDFSDRVRAEAALAVTELADQQRFLPRLRELAATRVAENGKSKAVLALARMRDEEAAAVVAEALPLWRDPELLERGLLLCALTLDRPVQDFLPEAQAGAVLALWKQIEEVQARWRDSRIVGERVAFLLTNARAHWTLARDDLRMAVLRELLELDKVVFTEPRDGDGPGGGDDNPPPPPPGGGGDPPPQDEPGPPQQRRGKQDTARIELDLRQWLLDFPPFELADPFAR